MRTLRSLPLLLALALLSAGCDDDVTGPQIPADVTFDSSLGVDLSAMTDVGSGLYIQTLTAGQDGAVVGTGDVVWVDYTLWLPNGTLIDTRADQDFTLDVGSVIDGFRLGMEGMSVGETRLIVIPSALGYGARGNSGIPPHSVLVFQVTLNDLNPPT